MYYRRFTHCWNQQSKGRQGVAYLWSKEEANLVRTNGSMRKRWVWTTNLVRPERGKDELSIAPGQPIHDGFPPSKFRGENQAFSDQKIQVVALKAQLRPINLTMVLVAVQISEGFKTIGFLQELEQVGVQSSTALLLYPQK